MKNVKIDQNPDLTIRETSCLIVDMILGFTSEFNSDPEYHKELYDQVEDAIKNLIESRDSSKKQNEDDILTKRIQELEAKVRDQTVIIERQRLDIRARDLRSDRFQARSEKLESGLQEVHEWITTLGSIEQSLKIAAVLKKS